MKIPVMPCVAYERDSKEREKAAANKAIADALQALRHACESGFHLQTLASSPNITRMRWGCGVTNFEPVIIDLVGSGVNASVSFLPY